MSGQTPPADDLGVKSFSHAAFLETTGRCLAPSKCRQSRSNSGVLDLGKGIVSGDRDQGHTSVFLFILTVRVRRFFTFVFSFSCKLLISNGQPLRRMADFDCLSTSLSPSVFGRIWPPSLMLSRSCAPHAALPAPPVRTPPALPHI